MASHLLRTNNGEVPKDYVLPREKIPDCVGNAEVPIVDLHDEKNLNKHMMKAIQEFGYFQVINHGVSSELMKDAMGVFTDVFDLPPEEISKINMKGSVNQFCTIGSSRFNYNADETLNWRNWLRMHSCHPLEERIKYWAEKPEYFREVTKAYVEGLLNLGSMILEHISQGLGLEKTYFANERSGDCMLVVNQYPASPDPSSTIGLKKHTDPSIITILQTSNVPGLQVLKDGQWLGLEIPQGSFLVFIGSMLQVVSNGKMKSLIHMVRNAKEAKVSSAFFVSPTKECIVEPAKKLIESQNMRPLYKPFKYEEFYQKFIDGKGDKDAVIDEHFKIDYE